MNLRIPTPADLSSAARAFVAAMDGHRVFAFDAPMGAGKTTFIRAVCEELGVEDMVTSPTFAIVNEYAVRSDTTKHLTDTLGEKPKRVYHFDLYRLKNIEELFDIGAEDYFYSGQPCFIEWPEMAAGLLPDDTLYIYIRVEDDGTRIVTTENNPY